MRARSGSASPAEGAGLPAAMDGIARDIVASTRPTSKTAVEAQSPEAGTEGQATAADGSAEDGLKPSAVSCACNHVHAQHFVCSVRKAKSRCGNQASISAKRAHDRSIALSGLPSNI